MANLRANKIVGIGSTDTGVTFDGPISLNTQGYMYFSTGNTTDRFPDFSAVEASSARGLFGGGAQPFSDKLNLIEFITISTTGNTQDFGDLTVPRYAPAGVSDSHGGLLE